VSTDWEANRERLQQATARLKPTAEQLAHWASASDKPSPSPFLVELVKSARFAALAACLAAALVLGLTWQAREERGRDMAVLMEAGWMP
jgi:ABC-type Fe3+ transport system permease subunit